MTITTISNILFFLLESFATFSGPRVANVSLSRPVYKNLITKQYNTTRGKRNTINE